LIARFIKSTGSLLSAIVLLCLTTISAENFDASENFRSAMTAFKEKNFYSARLLLQEIVLKDARGEFGDDAQYYLAMSYFYEGDYKSAQFEFRALLRDFPESPFIVRAAFWTGEAWFQRKKYHEALESHTAFVRKYPENVLSASALYTIGFIYNEQKRYDEAVEVLNRALKDYPASSAAPALTLQAGIAHFNAKEYTRARRQFETLLVKYTEPENLSAARFWLGKSYFAEDKLAEALTEFSVVVKDYPASEQASEAMYLSALCRYKAGERGEAIEMLARAAEKYPKSTIYPFVRLRQAQLLVEHKEDNAALAPLIDITNNHRTHETFAPALELIAEIRRRQGKTAEALAMFEALRDEKSLKGAARRELLRRYGDLLYQDNQFARAAEIYAELSRETPAEYDSAINILLLARAQYRDGKYDAALSSLNRLEKNYDDETSRAEALFLKGEISYALGKFTDALQIYARLARKYKDHPKVFDAEMGIGWTYFELKQYVRAADNFRKVLKQYKKPVEQAKALIALGACQYNLRDLDGALASYRRVKEKFAVAKTEAAEAQYQIAWLLFRRNRHAEAAQEFTTYLTLTEGNHRIAEALYFGGLSKFQNGDYDGAERDFAAVVARSDATAWLREKALADLGKNRAALKNYSSGRDAYRQLLGEYPETQNRDEAEYQIIVLSLKLDDETTALDVLKALKKRNKASTWYAEALSELAEFYRRRKNFSASESALTELEALRKKGTERHEVSITRAGLYAEQGKYAEALKVSEQVLLSEDVSETSAIRASTLVFQLLERQRDYKKGAQHADKLARRFADNARLADEMLLAQGRFLILLKDIPSAREVLLPLSKSRNAAARAKLLLGETYYNEGNHAQALDYFRQISQKQDASSWLKARYLIGEILFAKQEYEEAAREFSRIAYAETRDDAVYELSLYRAAQSFRKIKKDREADTFREKLKEAFPQSKYLRELEQ